MTEGNQRQLRVLHIVSSGGIAAALQPSLFLPLLTRLPKQRVKVQVVSLAPGCVPAAMLRQCGIPVHDVSLSRSRFSVAALGEIRQAAQRFRPDIIQAWGHTAQIVSTAVRKRCDWKPRVVWSVAETTPLPKNFGFIDRQKLKFAVRASAQVDRIVYTSEAGAAHHRRVGYPDGGHECIGPGVDAARFKPDPAARSKVREQLHLPADAFVIGMAAPFQPEYDHATFLKGIGELIKTNPHLYVLLAGHGVQRGNAPLMAMLGGGTLGTRTQLLGEWSDLASLFNACDLVCSSALVDSARMTLATAMLCGVPCVATGLGAQGELIGQHGVAIEPGSPTAFIRGIGKILEMTQEKRIQVAQAARKYALQHFVYVRSLQKYMALYCDLVGRETQTVEAAAAAAVPPPVPEAALEVAIASAAVSPAKPKAHTPTIAEIADPDSLEARVTAREPEALPKWRIEQEQARAKQEEQLAVAVSSSAATAEGDVLQIFEMEIANPSHKAVSPMNERARGYVEEFEELLSPDVLTAAAWEESKAPDAPPPANEPCEPAVRAVEAQAFTQSAPTSTEESMQSPEAPRSSPAERAMHDECEIPRDAGDILKESMPAGQQAARVVVVQQPKPDSAAVSQQPAIEASDSNAAAASIQECMRAPDVAPDAAASEPKQASLFDLDDLPQTPKTALSG